MFTLVVDLISRGMYPESLETVRPEKQILAARTESRSDGDFPGASECCVPTRVTLYGYSGSWGKGGVAWSAESSYSAGASELRMLPSGREDNVATFFATYCDPLLVICKTSLFLARTAHKGEQLPVFLWL